MSDHMLPSGQNRQSSSTLVFFEPNSPSGVDRSPLDSPRSGSSHPFEDVKKIPDQHGLVTAYLTNCEKSGVEPFFEFIQVLSKGSNECILSKRNHEISDQAIRCLCAALEPSKRIEVLDLSDNQLTRDGFSALASLLRVSTSIQNVKLNQVCMEDDSCAGLGQALLANPSSRLRFLGLQGNAIGQLGALSLARVLQPPTTSASFSKISTLDLGNNKVMCAGATSLADAIKSNSSLRVLVLNRNEIGNDGAVALGEALKSNEALQELYLSENKISDVGVASLMDGLCENGTLVKLELRFNHFGDRGARNIAVALTRNKRLEELHVGFSRIREEGVVEICKALEENTTLRFIDIEGIPISTESVSNYNTMRLARAMMTPAKADGSLQGTSPDWASDQMGANGGSGSFNLSRRLSSQMQRGRGNSEDFTSSGQQQPQRPPSRNSSNPPSAQMRAGGYGRAGDLAPFSSVGEHQEWAMGGGGDGKDFVFQQKERDEEVNRKMGELEVITSEQLTMLNALHERLTAIEADRQAATLASQQRQDELYRETASLRETLDEQRKISDHQSSKLSERDRQLNTLESLLDQEREARGRVERDLESAMRGLNELKRQLTQTEQLAAEERQRSVEVWRELAEDTSKIGGAQTPIKTDLARLQESSNKDRDRLSALEKKVENLAADAQREREKVDRMDGVVASRATEVDGLRRLAEMSRVRDDDLAKAHEEQWKQINEVLAAEKRKTSGLSVQVSKLQSTVDDLNLSVEGRLKAQEEATSALSARISRGVDGSTSPESVAEQARAAIADARRELAESLELQLSKQRAEMARTIETTSQGLHEEIRGVERLVEDTRSTTKKTELQTARDMENVQRGLGEVTRGLEDSKRKSSAATAELEGRTVQMHTELMDKLAQSVDQIAELRAVVAQQPTVGQQDASNEKLKKDLSNEIAKTKEEVKGHWERSLQFFEEERRARLEIAEHLRSGIGALREEFTQRERSSHQDVVSAVLSTRDELNKEVERVTLRIGTLEEKRWIEEEGAFARAQHEARVEKELKALRSDMEETLNAFERRLRDFVEQRVVDSVQPIPVRLSAPEARPTSAAFDRSTRMLSEKSSSPLTENQQMSMHELDRSQIFSQQQQHQQQQQPSMEFRSSTRLAPPPTQQQMAARPQYGDVISRPGSMATPAPLGAPSFIETPRQIFDRISSPYVGSAMPSGSRPFDASVSQQHQQPQLPSVPSITHLLERKISDLSTRVNGLEDFVKSDSAASLQALEMLLQEKDHSSSSSKFGTQKKF